MSKQLKRRYRTSDASLIQQADGLHLSATRDSSELLPFGVTISTMGVFTNLRNALSDTSTDAEMMGHLITATQNKNARRVLVIRSIKLIAERARIKFGQDDGRFLTYGVAMLSKQKDDTLIRTGRRVLVTAESQMTELASEGLTEDILTDLSDHLNHFDAMVDAQFQAIQNRDLDVERRILAGNALYNAMVTLAAKGKLCWDGISEAHYNDYILTEHSNPAMQVTEGTVGANESTGTSVNNVEPQSELTLQNTGDSVLSFFFAEHLTDTSGPNPVTLNPGQSQTVTAAELGFMEDERERFNVFNPGPGEGSYRIEWE